MATRDLFWRAFRRVFVAGAVCATIGLSARGDTVKPITKLKKLYMETDIIAGREARSVILYPPGAEYRAAAQELGRRVEAKFGVRLPVKPDRPPAAWRDGGRNLLVLGHLGNSPLLRWLHFRSLIYPPSVKRRIRTAHDPWGDGRNVVMLGGVDLPNVKANFEPLLKMLRRGERGRVFLSRTLDPIRPLSDYYKREIAKRRENWSRLPLNYMAYYVGWAGKHYALSGNDEFVELYRDAMLRLAHQKSYVHLYLFREVRHWDLVEESPVLTDADRLAITNFFRNCVASDKEGIGWVRRYVRSQRAGRLVLGNHPTQAACGVLVTAEYLNKYYPSPTHNRWYREALDFFAPYNEKGCYVSDEMSLQFASVTNIMNAVTRTTNDPAKHPYLRCTLERIIPCINKG